ncbi:hypothetical protein HY065_03480 [Candidatus Berkelbacteria bacterium]|nr:hypothetical protein [Candidatus Berkelbacteria bacterium]
MMYQAIKNFHTQFAFEPVIAHGDTLRAATSFLVVGMGGSALGANLFQAWDPSLDIIVYKDYGLPPIDLKKRTVIVSSYSGNTEETVEALTQCIGKKFNCVVVTSGGKLLEIAERQKLPYVRIPDTGIQPRSALGYNTRALAKIFGNDRAARELAACARTLSPAAHEPAGKKLAAMLKNRVPIIYTSRQNAAIGYNWKIKCNETAKIPAFTNVIPELNHNEMNGFDAKPATKALSVTFHFLILTDSEDMPQIQRRFEVLAKLYEQRGLHYETITFDGKTRFERIFNSLILADWFAYYSGEHYGVETTAVPMVEEFKRLIANA